jgi:hypothetical protein
MRLPDGLLMDDDGRRGCMSDSTLRTGGWRRCVDRSGDRHSRPRARVYPRRSDRDSRQAAGGSAVSSGLAPPIARLNHPVRAPIDAANSWQMLRLYRPPPAAGPFARSARASHPQCGRPEMRRLLMPINRRVPISCRHRCRRKEPLHSEQRFGRPRYAVQRPLLSAGGDNFRDNLRKSSVPVTRSLSYT